MTRSLDQTDISMMLMIERKTGLKLDFFKRFVKRFI